MSFGGHHGHVAEQRDDGKPGAEVEPAGSNTPATPPSPPPIDQAELEQFRQFQQFQDYLRFTQTQQGNQPAPPAGAGQVQQYSGGQPPIPPGPSHEVVPAERRRRPAPKWLTWLGKKVIAWVLAFVVLIVAGTWLYNHYFPSDKGEDTQTFVQHGGGKYHTNQSLPTDPFQAVRGIYDAIGKPDSPESKVDHVCLLMSNEAQLQFGRDLGYPDCASAVPALSSKVTDMNSYIYAVRPISSMLIESPMTIHSCWYSVQGGPVLGSFTLTKVELGQWLITGHSNDPATCPASPTGNR